MEKEMHLLPKQLAERWHVKIGTLSNWRVHGGGPRFIKFGRRILYPISEVEAFEKQGLHVTVHVKAPAEDGPPSGALSRSLRQRRG